MGLGTPRVHIVVLNWNEWALTEACLDSLLIQRYAAVRVTVVDNASTDGSPARFEAWRARLGTDDASRFDLVVNPENLGFAEGNNRGIRHALAHDAEYLLVLNNDTVVDPAAVGSMVATAVAEDAGMVAPAVFDEGDRDRVDRFGIVLTRSGSAYDRVSRDDGPLLCPSGCAALYRRDLVETLGREDGGFFDREFFMYAEDVDVGLRATARGYRTSFAGEAVIYHKGSAALGRGSPSSYRYRHRNTIWAVAKNYGGVLLWREAPFLLAGQLVGLANAVRRGRVLPVLRGKWEGVLGAWRMRRKAKGPRVASLARIDRRFGRSGRARIDASVSAGSLR